MAEKKLTRSANKMLGGVCAGLAEYFGIDATAMRAAYAVASIFLAGFSGIILYIVLLLIMPEAAPKANNVEDVEFTEAEPKAEPKKGAKKK